MKAPTRDWGNKTETEEDEEETSKSEKMNSAMVEAITSLGIKHNTILAKEALTFVSHLKDSSFFPKECKATSLPSNIYQTITNTEEVVSLLNFILKPATDKTPVDVTGIPLLLTEDCTLQRFVEGRELYRC